MVLVVGEKKISLVVCVTHVLNYNHTAINTLVTQEAEDQTTSKLAARPQQEH